LSAISPIWAEEGPGTGKLIDWPGAAMTALGNEGVAQKVKISHGSIGYMEYGFARRLGLPVATLQNKTGEYIKPSAESGRAALAAAAADLPDDLRLFIPDAEGPGSYPIVSLSWILLRAAYGDPAKANALTEAITQGLTEGQEIAEEMGYIPLPEEIVSKATAAVATVQ
jgi:phosphate transport system substrate-binding protein